MTLEKLKELGLTEEQQQKVMALKGQYFAELEKERDDAKTELATAEAQLQEVTQDRDAQLEKLKTANPEELKQQIEQLQEDYKTQGAAYEEQLQALKKRSAIVQHLYGKVHDADIVLAQLDGEKITVENGTVKGLEEQLEALKENKAFLFTEEGPTGTGGSKGNTAKDGRGAKKVTKEEFEKMNYAERLQIYETDKALFEELQGE